MTTWRLAWRNVWRSPRRTGLALTAMALSVALVLAYDSILRGYGNWLVDAITGPMLGHVQVHAPEWRRERTMDRTIPHVSQLLERIATDPSVTGVTARIYAPALVAVGDEGFSALVVGLIPVRDTGPSRLLDGRSPAPAGKGVLVGRALAEQMGVTTGVTLAIVGQGVDGSTANDLYTVLGVIETPLDLVNRQGVLMALPEAQALFALDDEAHELVVHGRASAQAPALARHLASLPVLSGLEILDWRALAPQMVSMLEIVDMAWLLVLGLVMVAAAAGVANTMLMATFERTREFGMLLSLGTRPSRIVRLVLAEAVVLGVLGAAIGSAAGLSLVYATRNGLDYAALTGGGPSAVSFGGIRMTLMLYPALTMVDVLRLVSAVVLTSLAAAAWPAVRAAHLEPAQAMRRA